ncbi:MarR family winged helix-turn-helix transcriptional regulator [Kosakonia oryzendophytica]|uniref:MarR family winged helix-turn-helix transcriptional regulator n=1 Tax=Kosakonia oryzendophytica TaxID=1005665 RepID=UPI003D349B33
MDNHACLSRAHLLYLASHNLQLLIEQKIKAHNIGFNSWLILVCIHNEAEKLTQRQLAQRLGLKDPSVGELVKHLMKLKFLARAIDTHDRRKYAIKITEQGIVICNEIHAMLAPLFSHVFDLPAAELQQFDAILENIRAVTKASTAQEGDVGEIPPTGW